MKLLFCTNCHDIKLLQKVMTRCNCGNSYGQYLQDGLHAEVGGSGRVIGIANPDIYDALERPDHPTIRCWMMNESPHLKRIR